MEKKNKKNKRFGKLLRTVVPTLMIIICLSACVLPSYAVSEPVDIKTASPSEVFNGYGYGLIMANNDMMIDFYGIDGELDLINPSSRGVYVSNSCIGGCIIGKTSTGNAYGVFTSDQVRTSTVVSASTEEGDNIILDSADDHSSLDYMGFMVSADDVGKDHKTYHFRYKSHWYMQSAYKPIELTMTCSELYIAPFMFTNYANEKYNGYGGLVFPYAHDDQYPSAVAYTMTAKAYDYDGNVTSINYNGTSVKSNKEFYIPLISNEVLTTQLTRTAYYRLTDISVRVYLKDELVPTISTSPSFTIQPIQEIFVDDSAKEDMGLSNFRMTDYDFLFDLWMWNRTFNQGGSYSQGYDEGYTAGDEAGYERGYTAGEIAGKATGYQDGLEDGKELGYENGRIDGYGDGYNVGKKEGDEAGYERGYDEGYTAGDIAGYERGYEAGDKAGYSNGYTQGDIDGFARGNEAGYKRGYAIGFDAGIMDTMNNMNFTEWLGTAVGGFLDFTLFGNVTIGGILAVCIALALVMLFLKFFAGG